MGLFKWVGLLILIIGEVMPNCLGFAFVWGIFYVNPPEGVPVFDHISADTWFLGLNRLVLFGLFPWYLVCLFFTQWDDDSHQPIWGGKVGYLGRILLFLWKLVSCCELLYLMAVGVRMVVAFVVSQYSWDGLVLVGNHCTTSGARGLPGCDNT